MSTLAPKEWPKQKIMAILIAHNLYKKVPLFYLFDYSLGVRAEICQIFLLVKKFILKLSDL